MPVRNRIQPSVSIRMMIRMEIAQKIGVWPGLGSPNWLSPNWRSPNEPCHTTSTTEMTSKTAANPYNRRFLIKDGPYPRLYVPADPNFAARRSKILAAADIDHEKWWRG